MSLRHDSRRHGRYELVCASTTVTLAEAFQRARHFPLAWHYSQSGRRASKGEGSSPRDSAWTCGGQPLPLGFRRKVLALSPLVGLRARRLCQKPSHRTTLRCDKGANEVVEQWRQLS